ncbi:MAG: type II toxin-antitoxin system HipA family toxin [Paludibacteraceae bacterium]|nr:type II toxin-antitoxin system HipA family toxin [Paludibacteraceae bacterium]
MVNLAKVYIWGEYAGAVLWNENTASATFEYEPSFVNKGWDLSPLMMPINENRAHSFRDLSKDTFMGLPGLLADALPDSYGKALLDRWLVSLGRTFANPVERLCYQSKRSMGALEFIPAKDDYLDKSSVIEISSLVQVAAEVLSNKSNLETNLKEDTKEALVNIIKVSTSAGGQRAKAVIAYNDTTGEVRSGQLDAAEGFDHWLLKLDGVTNAVLGDPQHYGKIEYAYYKMALKAGIEMTECRLLEENGRSHFMTKRFDRKGGNEKIHMQTLCGMAHYDYKMLHAYSYEQAFQVMRRLRLPYGQAEQMFKRMAFNVIARNQDDHTKNISFLMDRTGTWMLSPAYDMSWAYNPKGEWTSHHQMSINNKWDNITRADLLAVAEAMHIKKADSIINEICDAVSMWPIVAKELDIPYNMIAMIDDTLLYRSY